MKSVNRNMIPEVRDRFDKRLKQTLASAAKSPLTPEVRNSLTARVRSLVNEATEFGLSNAVDEVSNFFLSRERFLELSQPQALPTGRVMELGQAGLAATVEFAVNDSPGAFDEIPVDVLLRQISSRTLL